MRAIYKREIKASFCNMSAPIFLSVALILIGIFSLVINLVYGDSRFEGTLSSAAFLLVLVIPILTMRSFSEEKSAKTDQLLYSLPVKMTDIVMGKFLAILSIFGVFTALMCVYPLLFSFFAEINYAAAYGMIFAFFLLGASIIAIGMFFSTLTESQVIAAVSTYGVILLLYLMEVIVSVFPADGAVSLIAFAIIAIALGVIAGLLTKNKTLGFAVGTLLLVACIVTYVIDPKIFDGAFPALLSGISIFSAIDTFMNGIFDVAAVVYYISVTVLFLFLTVQSMDKKRWR